MVGGISRSDGSDGALRRVRFVAVESPASEAGVPDTPEMLTSDTCAVDAFAASTLLARCGFLADFSNVSTFKTTATTGIALMVA